MVIYSTKVIGMGDNAIDFSIDDTFITFANDIPDTLEKYCYYLEPATLSAYIKAGDRLEVNGISYKITAVGSAVNDNIRDYGHACYKFNGRNYEEMPGTVNLESKEFPNIHLGTRIQIISDDVYESGDTTTELLKSDLLLKESYTDFITEHVDDVKTTKLSVFLREMVFQTGQNINEVFKNQPLSTSYIYQILNGDRMPSRDKLILFCLILAVDLDKVNRALKYAQKRELYVKDERDCIIMHGFAHGKKLDEVNMRLLENNLEVLA